MLMIREALANVRNREEGATAVEYAIMVALIAAVIIAAVTVLGTNSNDAFCDAGNAIGSASASSC